MKTLQTTAFILFLTMLTIQTTQTTPKMTPLRSNERGSADYGWLKTRHTFSFARYYNPKYQQFESLRVINEDYVEEGEGFPLHPHSNFEIFSYIISGTIIHKDSMNNTEECSRGDIQFTSAGRGISHSEYAKEGAGQLHLLQIWVKPSTLHLTPSYSTAHFSDLQKTNNLCAILSPVGRKEEGAVGGPIGINQDILIFASILEKDHSLSYSIGEKRKGFVHVIEKDGVRLRVRNDVGELIELSAGDGLFLDSSQSISFDHSSDQSVEFLFFDIAVINY